MGNPKYCDLSLFRDWSKKLWGWLWSSAYKV